MKIVLTNETFELPARVITEQLQPKIDVALTKYKEYPLQKRLMLKAGIRTAQALAEQYTGIRIELPQSDDIIITVLENLPVWITEFMERVEIDAETVSDLTTRYQTVTRAGIRFKS